MSVQTFGIAVFRRAVSNWMVLAIRAEEHVRESRTPELLTPTSLRIVCFRITPDGIPVGEEYLEQVNQTVLAKVFWNDRAFISSTLFRGTFSLRMCILNHTPTMADVRETLGTAERFGAEELSYCISPTPTVRIYSIKNIKGVGNYLLNPSKHFQYKLKASADMKILMPRGLSTFQTKGGQ